MTIKFLLGNLKKQFKTVLLQTVNSKTFSKPTIMLWKVFDSIALGGRARLFLCGDLKERARIASLTREIKSKVGTLSVSEVELYQIFISVRNTAYLEGDCAEVGVYTGSSALMIAEAKEKRHLHLFDTFEGLPKPSQYDTIFQEGQYPASYEEVGRMFFAYQNVHLYKGLFPSTTAINVLNKVFSFVHLDVDLFQSTLDCLDFFYPRMARGGVILSHDYIVPAVKKAIDGFLKNKPEIVISLLGTQCLIVKL